MSFKGDILFVRVTRVDKSLPMPKYHTEGSVGFDFYCRESCEIPPKEFKLIPQNLIVETPKTHALLIFARSSLHKKGLLLLNGVGVVDQDFCGPENEIKAILYNYTDTIVKVEKGDRLVQGLFLDVLIPEFEDCPQIKEVSRGEIGSTGHR